MNEKLLRKFANLAVKVGVNIKEGQLLVVNAPVECYDFVRLIVEEAYKAKAGNVVVKWNDAVTSKQYYLNVSDDVLKEIPDHIVKQGEYFVEKNGAFLSIASPNPGLMSDVNPMKMMIAQKAANEKMSFLRKYTMSNGGQWTVIAAPNYEWAKKVFPDAKFSEVVDKLWDAILAASRVREDNDPVQEWTEHMERLAAHNKKLNEYNFQKLNFKNDLGTDLEVKLVENHIWGGGGEIAQNGVYFAPNIPTEETFSMPHKDGVNGKVVSTKPLNYSGKLIEGFWLEFKDGKVVKYHADKEEDALKSLLELDEGSSRLGEVALISHDSPISNTNILFYNTLFDENASCHLALGNAYTMNIKDGHKLSEEELIKKGYNKSMTHVDFMFGSSDMKVIGTTQDGKEVTVFEKGNFVF